ncbi:response regulator [Flavobacterium olei]|uniref:response regulator n=1 Tax=Flavobacterium olei TaxID=1886782 RepID=UPI003219453C
MNKSGEILVVEDDQDDRDFLSDIFDSLEYPNKIVYFEDPTTVIPYLKSMNNRPFMILSDINMPKLDGFELRKLINQDNHLSRKCVPYIFLSTSETPENVERAFELSANGYFKKESNFSVYKSMISDIITYWKRSSIPMV